MNILNFMQYFFIISFYFIIYAHLGWCLETVYATIKDKVFVNRGFLHGPYCSMYGFGALSIVILAKPFQYNLMVLYLYSVIITTIIEYITGYVLEKSFNTTWWDYSKRPLNIHGRICLMFSLLWGIISVLLVKVIHPFFNKFEFLIWTTFGKSLILLFLILMLIDLILTLKSLSKLNYSLNELKELYEDFRKKFPIKDKFEDNLDRENPVYKEKLLNAFDEFKQRYEGIYNKIQNQYSRYFKAFPQYTKHTLKNFIEDLKKKLHSRFKE